MNHKSWQEQERNFTWALIWGLRSTTFSTGKPSGKPSRVMVEVLAEELAEVFGYKGDLEPVVTAAMNSVDDSLGDDQRVRLSEGLNHE